LGFVASSRRVKVPAVDEPVGEPGPLLVGAGDPDDLGGRGEGGDLVDPGLQAGMRGATGQRVGGVGGLGRHVGPPSLVHMLNT
jgi:hypothetical protein